MNEIITLPVFEIVGSSLCVASDDGQKVYERIRKAIKQEKSVGLSFMNISSLTSAFLNAAIGQLYGEFSEEEIRAKLTVKDMEPDDLFLLKRVVETAKAYFKDPELHRKATEELLGANNG
ncbi:MAG: STAS-like domain-containing protein [Desulfomonilaceae bacterium]